MEWNQENAGASAGTDEPKARSRISRKVGVGIAVATVVVGGAAGVAVAASGNGSHPATGTSGAGFPGGAGPGAGGEGSGAGPGAGGMGRGGPGGAGGPGGGLTGTISSIDGSTLKVKSSSGTTYTVTTSSSTAVEKAAASTVSSIASGDHVMVMATGSGSTVTARNITDSGTSSTPNGTGPAGAGPGGRGGPGRAGGPGGGSGNSGGAMSFVTGTVSSVNGSTLEVKEASGTVVTVDTDSSTMVVKISAINLSDLAAGEPVAVMGQTSSSDKVTATRITEGDVRAMGGPGGGTPPGAWPGAQRSGSSE